MRQRTHKILFAVHSWAGVLTGALMFLVCFSGAIVVFKHEIDLWANPSLRLQPLDGPPASLDRVLEVVAQRHPGAVPEFVDLPDDVNPGYFVFVRDAGVRVKLAAQGASGELIGPVDSELGQFTRALHVFLFFGPRWIVGALGVVMLVMIGTGFFIHRKILKELFTQRWDRSLRVLASDLHKVLGIWGLLFHIVIAFTGAWLGLAPLFERAAAFVAGAPAEAPRARAKTAPAAMASLDDMRRAALAALPGFEPRTVSLRNWGRADAVVGFHGNLSDHLASTANVTFAGASGALRGSRDPRTQGFWGQFNGVMEPLHFGDFGGLWLKWLYFLLGLSPAILSLSGTILWIDRRRRREGAAGAEPQHA
jgi:uncharacterized iron-regulated membrane protein